MKSQFVVGDNVEWYSLLLNDWVEGDFRGTHNQQFIVAFNPVRGMAGGQIIVNQEHIRRPVDRTFYESTETIQ
jgi:hypothetical protein